MGRRHPFEFALRRSLLSSSSRYTPKRKYLTPGTRCARRSATSVATLPAACRTVRERRSATFVTIYALTGDGFDAGALRRHADDVARELRAVDDVKKVD